MTGSVPTQSKRRRVVCAWATPRSVSTAFEKTFTQRTHTTVVHEPFTDCYYFGPRRRSSRYGARAACGDPATAIADILDRPSAPEVFVKDLAFQAEPYLTDRFLTVVTSTFLIRHPRFVYRSLLPLKGDFTEEEFGFTALHRLFTRVTVATGQPPVVVDGTQFQRSPETVLRRYCAGVGLDFDPAMLHWADGRIRPWRPGEEESQAKWHAALEASHRILPPQPTDNEVHVPPGRRAAFDRAVDIYEEISAAAVGTAATVTR